jgi:hypothetical protein
MSSNFFYDSDDERDSFDVERRQIDIFQKNFLSASVESSEDDEECIIDGTKIPSSTKLKSRARHSFLDLSELSSTSSKSIQEEIDENPFDIISKSIDIENIKPIKKKKSLGVPKSRVFLDTTDIYEQDDSHHSRDSLTKNDGIVDFFKFFYRIKFLFLDDDNEENDNYQSSKIKSNNKVRWMNSNIFV